MEAGFERDWVGSQSLRSINSVDRSLWCRNEGIPSILAAQQGESSVSSQSESSG